MEVKKIVLIFFCLVSCMMVVGQKNNDPINIGYYKKIHSDILNEDRIISNHLPENYDKSNTKYPVVHHLYGDRIEQYFAEAVSVVSNLVSNGIMPEMILVGINESNLRYRDLLPHQLNGDSTGIDLFTGFLQNELIPYIDKNYRTIEYRILAVPQVGANYGIYTLFSYPEMFDAYIITNPFRWKGGRNLLFEKIKQYILDHNSLNKFLFITHDVSDELEREGNTYIEEFKTIINNSGLTGLKLEFNFLSNNYDFNSRTGLEIGLRKLFNNYARPSEIEFHSLTEILNYYEKLSEELGFSVEVPDLILALKYFKKVPEIHPDMTMVMDIISELEK